MLCIMLLSHWSISFKLIYFIPIIRKPMYMLRKHVYQYNKHAYWWVYSIFLIICQCFIPFISDVNECKVNTDICPDYSICTNLVGGYQCTCSEGFYWVEDLTDPLYKGRCEGMLNTKLCLHVNMATIGLIVQSMVAGISCYLKT